MNYSKVIVCLANSRKPSGRCIAGKEYILNENREFTIGDWVRPVSQRETREISENERIYNNGITAKNLDIIGIEFTQVDNHLFQSENNIINPDVYWTKKGIYNPKHFEYLLDKPNKLWTNGNHSTSGMNDRISATSLQARIQSLYFIQPENLVFSVGREGLIFGNDKKTLRAKFNYNNEEYWIKVSDPVLERLYFSKKEGDYSDHNIKYLTMSLGEIYQGNAYKLVAAGF